MTHKYYQTVIYICSWCSCGEYGRKKVQVSEKEYLRYGAIVKSHGMCPKCVKWAGESLDKGENFGKRRPE